MVEITPGTSSNILPSFTPQLPAQEPESNPLIAFVSKASTSAAISDEGQYVFKMDIYLSLLDKDEQDKAIEFLSKSNDPLHAKALENFNKSQEIRKQFTDEVIKSISEQSEAAAAKAFKPVARDPAAKPEIGVWPAETAVFRLDGQKDYYPLQWNTFNDPLKAQLDKVESDIPANINIQDKVNLIGTVRNALYASENIQLSFDDVLNFNYLLEKAHTTINQIDAPDDIKATLRSILKQSVSYQNIRQSNFLSDIQPYVNNERVGAIARENIRLGTAAQAYNNQLQTTLNATNLSVLNAGPVMTKLLLQHTDLIRFTPNKMNEAISFYQQDFDTYEDFLKNGYRPPIDKPFEMNTSQIEAGNSYAFKVIEEIQNYISKNKAG